MSHDSETNKLENILSKLNAFLKDDHWDENQFDHAIKELKEQFNPKIGLIDFKYFDERRLKKALIEKRKAEQAQNFEYTCNQLYLECVCEKYIELKQQFSIYKSMFLYEKNILLYCHYGTSKNDSQIMPYIIRDENYIKLNIKI